MKNTLPLSPEIPPCWNPNHTLRISACILAGFLALGIWKLIAIHGILVLIFLNFLCLGSVYWNREKTREAHHKMQMVYPTQSDLEPYRILSVRSWIRTLGFVRMTGLGILITFPLALLQAQFPELYAGFLGDWIHEFLIGGASSWYTWIWIQKPDTFPESYEKEILRAEKQRDFARM